MLETDTVIIGAGPAGLTSAIYLRRAARSCVLLEKEFVAGGQMLSTGDIENYPGCERISGMELAKKMHEQAMALGAQFVAQTAISINKEENGFTVTTDDEKIYARSVIIASGAKRRHLGVTGEDELAGMGVSYCATCDGAFFSGKEVAIVGGGNTALEDALILSKLCSKVYLIHRRESFRGEKILQNKVLSSDNIEVKYNCRLEKIIGQDAVEEIVICNNLNNKSENVKVSGVFISIGIEPNTEFCNKFVTIDKEGYIITENGVNTSIEGVFAAGDVIKKDLRQIVTATSDGAMAAIAADRYMN